MSTQANSPSTSVREALLAGALVVAAGALFAWGAQFLPVDGVIFGFDWNIYWQSIRGGWPRYDLWGVLNPPWTYLMILPLGQLPLASSWAVWTFLTLLVLLISLPWAAGRRTALMAGALLLTSFITLRSLADGNLTVIMVGGSLLLLRGWQKQWPWMIAAGVLLVTAKVQESALLLLGLAWCLWRTWPIRRWAQALGYVLIVVVPSLLVLGGEWLGRVLARAPGSALGVTLASQITRPGITISLRAFEPWLSGAPWLLSVAALGVLLTTVGLTMKSLPALSAEKIGLWVTATMLLSPYAGGLSLLSALALGALPIFTWRAGWGAFVILLTHAPYVFIALGYSDVAPNWPLWYWTIVLLLIWGACGWRVHTTEAAHGLR